jgi:adenylate kinase family enzyme
VKGRITVKIHIIGGPGSGKTTLAECISSRFNVAHYDLDHLYWKQDRGGASYIEEAFALASQSEWVTENTGLIWTDPLLYHADYIILLEVSWLVAAWRIIRRHIVKSLRGINPYPTKLLLPFLKDACNYYLNRGNSDVRDSMDLYFKDEHGDSVKVPDAELLLMHLEKYRFSIPLTAEFTRRYLEKYKEKVIIVRNNADRERLLELLSIGASGKLSG